ncbi:dynamin family protein [Cryptosporangium arvum]|uniref:dynamin family protein n=1 Tax=Cryptosporangium arvum TaxID=80871 RepID=UPI0004B40052|nr:dynamin family protein [Cryptosporangium arvum]
MTTPAAKPDPAAALRAVEEQIRGAIDTGLGHLRRLDPDLAADIDQIRRAEATQPTVVVVGETKRGKSSLINALLATPNLSPVDAAVATSAYLEFSAGDPPRALAHVPGDTMPHPLGLNALRDWGTVLGTLPDGRRPPQRIQVFHTAPLLQSITLIDTPGVGGLDSTHAEIALDAVARATALLFVVDASSPFSKPELDFLLEASKRVNLVMFALTKTDAFPGWRTVLDDDKALLHTHAPRFAQSAFFPVSARLAELADQMPIPEAAEEVRKESRIADLRTALARQVAVRNGVLVQANLLRTVRSELVGLDTQIGEKMRAVDPDPGQAEKLKAERAEFVQRKRKDARTWTLTLNTEVQRARVDSTALLRNEISKAQDHYLTIVEKANGERIKRLPTDIDQALQAIALRLSAEMERRFRVIGAQILREVFSDAELSQILARLNARLRSVASARPQRDGAGGDNALVITGAVGTASLLGNLSATGAGALLAGTAAGFAVPVIGLGVGLAAGAFMLYRRRVGNDRQAAKIWLREVLNEARASIAEEISHRFTDLQFALTVALDEAVERRVEQLDAQIAEIDKALADDKANRAKKRTALQTDRDAIRTRIKSLDEVLGKAKAATKITVPTGAPKAAAPKPAAAPAGGGAAGQAAQAAAGKA